MELKTLWLGLVLSLSVFAVKTGFGWAYLWIQSVPRRRAAASFAVLLGYAAVFALALLLAFHLDLQAQYEMLMPLWRNGTLFHWLTAILLLLWSLILLKAPASSTGPKRNVLSRKGWLPLVLPCPVCLSAVFMAVCGLALSFPESAVYAVVALFAVFVLMALAGGILLIRSRNKSATPPEATLGLLMLLASLYFMLSALLMPHLGDISKIYRMAAHARQAQVEDLTTALLTWTGIGILIWFGFFFTKRHIRTVYSTR